MRQLVLDLLELLAVRRLTVASAALEVKVPFCAPLGLAILFETLFARLFATSTRNATFVQAGACPFNELRAAGLGVVD